MKYMLIMRATDEAYASMANADFSEMLEIVGEFNEELIEAGVLLAAEGLADAAEGVVVDFPGRDPPGQHHRRVPAGQRVGQEGARVARGHRPAVSKPAACQPDGRARLRPAGMAGRHG
jgi:hypothetical protein